MLIKQIVILSILDGNNQYAAYFTFRENPLAVTDADIESMIKLHKYLLNQRVTGFKSAVSGNKKVLLLSNGHKCVIWKPTKDEEATAKAGVRYHLIGENVKHMVFKSPSRLLVGGKKLYYVNSEYDEEQDWCKVYFMLGDTTMARFGSAFNEGFNTSILNEPIQVHLIDGRMRSRVIHMEE